MLMKVVLNGIAVHEDDPRNLTNQQLAQPEKGADHIADGKIPIHRRLFHQWLHYVSPSHERPHRNLIKTVEAQLSQESEEEHGAKNTGQNRKISQEQYEPYVEMQEEEEG